MTKQELAKKAFEECSSENTTAHHGGGVGRPFWNPETYQFMYVPAFQFTKIPETKKYKYTAVDEKGQTHSFTADNSHAPLTPIWKDIPEGVVSLQVHALDNSDDSERYLIGARTFFKLASFPDDLPEAACSYDECVSRAFEYALSQGYIKSWLTTGKPDPEYTLNVYPSKMDASIVVAMLQYAKVYPEKAEEAEKIARAAADYMISTTPGEGAPLCGIPLTYEVDFRENPESQNNLCAMERLDTVMMIYPAHVGNAYLELEKYTGDEKYLDAALKIGKFYLENVQENGSWFLVYTLSTGKPSSLKNYCDPLERIVPFLMGLYSRTGDECWKTLADGAIAFVERDELERYDWQGQFEDSVLSANYSNLTHYGACALIRYYTQYFAHSEEHMSRAADLMRFVEDQFVIWKRPSPWNKNGYNTAEYLTPAGLEQYEWYVPIDASTADIMETFAAMYKVTGDELYLEKAKALGDSITRAQRENGMIPTHWMNENFLNDEPGMWINCMFCSATSLSKLSQLIKEMK